jgi:hypothetical protein
MSTHMLDVNVASSLANQSGMFTRVSEDGGYFVLYTGEADRSEGWVEAGRTIITNGFISRHAFDSIVNQHDASPSRRIP